MKFFGALLSFSGKTMSSPEVALISVGSFCDEVFIK